MQTRRLGNSDLVITPVGYGAWAIGGSGWQFAWGSQDDNESIAADTRLAEQSDYLQKPYRSHVLAAKVREVLTAQRLRPAASWSSEDFAEAV